MHHKNSHMLVAKLLFCIILLIGLFINPISATAAALDKMKVGGYIDLEYEKSDSSHGNENGSFNLHHFNLLMEAAVSERLTVKGHVEFENGVDTKSDFGGVLLEWAFGEYLAKDYLKFRGGKFITPFGLFNEIRDATPALLFISPPRSIYETQEIGGRPVMPLWNTGLGVSGDYSFNEDFLLDYIFYIGNGESFPSTNDAELDDNTNKALGGRIQIHPSFNSTLGFSIYSGDKSVASGGNPTHTTYGVSAAFDFHDFNITGEYFSSNLPNSDEKAYYILASYSFLHRYTPFIIYDYLDPDSNTKNDTWEDIGFGINIKLVESMHFKLEYHINELEGDRESFNEIKSAITIAF